MSQPIFWKSQVKPSTGTTYSPIFNGGGSGGFDATESRMTMPWAVDGVFQNMYISLGSAPGSGKSFTFTVKKNGSSTSMVVVISDAATSGSDTTHTVSVSPGDTLVVECVGSGTPTTSLVDFAVEFVPTTDTHSGYGGGWVSLIFANRTNNPFFPVSSAEVNWGASGSNGVFPVPISGTLAAMYYIVSVAAGGGFTHTFTIEKNGVLQDGSGGTVDTRATMTGAATTANASFSLPIAPGDQIRINVASDSGQVFGVALGARFVSDNSNESFIGNPGGFADARSTTNTEYTWLTNRSATTSGETEDWQTTESAQQQNVGGVGFSLGSMYLTYLPALGPGTGTSITFTVRVNGNNSAISVTIADADSTASDLTHSVSISPGDLVDMQAVPFNTPASRQSSWGIGVNTTVGGGGGGEKGFAFVGDGVWAWGVG